MEVKVNWTGQHIEQQDNHAKKAVIPKIQKLFLICGIFPSFSLECCNAVLLDSEQLTECTLEVTEKETTPFSSALLTNGTRK